MRTASTPRGAATARALLVVLRCRSTFTTELALGVVLLDAIPEGRGRFLVLVARSSAVANLPSVTGVAVASDSVRRMATVGLKANPTVVLCITLKMQSTEHFS